MANRTTKAATPRAGNRAQILVADDDDGVRALLVALLAKEGHVCVEADTGDEVRSRVAAGTIDLVICDIHMPGNEVLELLDLARGDQAIPFIVISADREPSVIVEAFRRAAIDFLSKPIDEEKLYERVDAALQKSASLRAMRRMQSDVQRWLSASASLDQRADFSADAYIAQSFVLMAQLSANLQSAIAESNGKVDLCSNLRCRRRASYEKAINRAIDVLEKTKGAFKSKELGELRADLETVLDGKH